MNKQECAIKSYYSFLTVLLIERNITKVLSFFSDTESFTVVGQDGILCTKEALAIVCEKQYWEMKKTVNFQVLDFLYKEIDSKNGSIVATVLLQHEGHSLNIYQSIIISYQNEIPKITMLHNSIINQSSLSDVANEKADNNKLLKIAWNCYKKPVSITDINRNIVYLNQPSLEILQKPFEECVGKPCKDVWNFPICCTNDCGIRCLENGLEEISFKRNNKMVRVEVYALKDASGKIQGYMEMGFDITETEDLNEKFQSLSANIPGGVCQVQLDEYFTLLYANEAFYKMYGCTKEHMITQYENKLSKYLAGDKFVIVKMYFEEAKRAGKKEVIYENRLFRPDGTELWILVRATLVKEETVANIVVIDITERKKMEIDLRVSQERLRDALERNLTNVFDYDIATKKMVQPDSIAMLYGQEREIDNVPESLLESGVICEDSKEDFYRMYQEIIKGEPTASKIIKTYTKDGELRFNKFSLSGIADSVGRPIRAIGFIEDVTRQQKMKFAFLQEEQYRDAMLSDVILYLEMNLTKDIYYKCKGKWNFKIEGELLNCYSKFIEATARYAVIGEFKKQYYDAFCIENAKDAFENGNNQIILEYQRKMSDGDVKWVTTTMNLVRDVINGDIKGFMYVKDIDERKKTELSLLHASCHDALTGVFNKVYAESFIKEIIENTEDSLHAFIILDVDHFKIINDTYGHFIGDCVLSEVAKSLLKAVGEQDIVGRIGGDEFAILIQNIPDVAYARNAAEKICHSFRYSLSNQENFPVVSCSIGISLFGRDGTTFEELYQNADYALYKAKALGRNRYVEYHLLRKNQSYQ